MKEEHTEIRISNHRLVTETGGFSKALRNEKNCLYCKADNFSEIDKSNICYYDALDLAKSE